MAIRFGNGFGIGASNGGGGSSLSFFTNMVTIATYLRSYMSDFRNPDFYEYGLDGNSGFYINDGGGDMYDNGNATSPWLISNATYTGDTEYSSVQDYPYAINYQTTATVGTMDTSFGYISLGYSSPNLLPLTVIGTRATIASAGTPIGFQCGGNIGADGGGTFVEGNIYTGDTVSGFTVHSYYRQTHSAGDPSVCDVFILLGHSNWNSVFGDVFYGGDSGNQGNGSYLYTTGSGATNILAIKTTLSKSNDGEVTFSEVNTVVDNFIMRINESQVSPTPTPTTSLTPTPTPSSTPTAICNSNYIVTDGGTTHVYDGEPGTLWNGYGDNYLQVGPSQGGPAPDAGWYFVDECGTIRQLLNDTLWFSGGSPSPFPNGTGWLCVADGAFVLTSGTTSLTLYETIPTVTFVTPTPTPTQSPAMASPTPTASVTPTVTPTQSSVAASPTPTATPTLTPSATLTPTGFMTISEVGSDVVMTVSGTIDLDGLTLVESNVGPFMGGGIGPTSATFLMGANGGYGKTYSGFTATPSNFGTGGGTPPTSTSGDIFGIITQGAPPYLLAVPTGYTTGANISSTQTFTGETFSSLGLTVGTYTYTWSGGSINVVIGGPAPTPTPSPSVGSNSGVGSWYFYSDEGNINAGAPIANGNAIFTIQGSPIVETFNPNENSGTSFLYFSVKDSVGTDYTTQFSGLTSGGTISIIQNGDVATYTGGVTSFMVTNSGGGNQFLVINTSVATQAVMSSAPFVYADPISIRFGS